MIGTDGSPVATVYFELWFRLRTFPTLTLLLKDERERNKLQEIRLSLPSTVENEQIATCDTVAAAQTDIYLVGEMTFLTIFVNHFGRI